MQILSWKLCVIGAKYDSFPRPGQNLDLRDILYLPKLQLLGGNPTGRAARRCENGFSVPCRALRMQCGGCCMCPQGGVSGGFLVIWNERRLSSQTQSFFDPLLSRLGIAISTVCGALQFLAGVSRSRGPLSRTPSEPVPWFPGTRVSLFPCEDDRRSSNTKIKQPHDGSKKLLTDTTRPAQLDFTTCKSARTQGSGLSCLSCFLTTGHTNDCGATTVTRRLNFYKTFPKRQPTAKEGG